jgi:hypothetical protein
MHMAQRDASFAAVGKLYVWSIVMEPLLFFVLAQNTAVGVTPNPGRILQFLVWGGLFAGWIATSVRPRMPNPAHGLYSNYTAYFAITAVAGVVGAAMGSYTLNAGYSGDNASSVMAAIIRSPAIRPFFEYFITLYYFIYFVVLPRYLLDSDAGLRYFFRVFGGVFMACIVLGALDLLLIPTGFRLIPRTITDGVDVGFRFHGVAGEPRDAFVYLIFGLATLSLREYWARRVALGRRWIIVIIVAALLTQSASGMFGLVFAGALILGFSVRYLSTRTLVLAGVLAISLAGAAFAGVYFSPRIQLYLKAMSIMFDRLDRGAALPAIMRGQMSNIYPLWDMYLKLKAGNFVQLLLGSGLGSSSVVSNNMGGFRELANPHTQVVRVLYESGVIGLYFLVMSFAAPVRRLTAGLPPDVRRRFLFLTLMLVGVFLSHRSSVPYIFLGIFMVVMQRINARALTEPATAPIGAVGAAAR